MRELGNLYVQYALGSDSIDWGTLPLVALMFIALVLLRRRKISSRNLLLSIAAAFLVGFIDLTAMPLEAIISNQRIRMLPLLAILVLFGLLLGAALLAGSLSRSFRSVDRLAIGAALSAICVLGFAYHALLINGILKAGLGVQQDYLFSAVQQEPETLAALCASNGWLCYSGNVSEGLPVHPSPTLMQQFSDYRGFYEEHTPGGAFAYADSNAILSEDTGYVYAYRQDSDGRYVWVIEARHEKALYRLTKAAFVLIMEVATYTWISLAALVIIAHNRMFARRHKIMLMRSQVL